MRLYDGFLCGESARCVSLMSGRARYAELFVISRFERVGWGAQSTLSLSLSLSFSLPFSLTHLPAMNSAALRRSGSTPGLSGDGSRMKCSIRAALGGLSSSGLRMPRTNRRPNLPARIFRTLAMRQMSLPIVNGNFWACAMMAIGGMGGIMAGLQSSPTLYAVRRNALESSTQSMSTKVRDTQTPAQRYYFLLSICRCTNPTWFGFWGTYLHQ